MWEVRSSCEIVNCTKGKMPFRLLVSIVQFLWYAVRKVRQVLFVINTHIKMVGGVCRLANPMVVERVARLRRDDILILTINSRFAPGRSIKFVRRVHRL